MRKGPISILVYTSIYQYILVGVYTTSILLASLLQGCNQRRSLFFSIKCSPYVLNTPRHTQHDVILRLHLPAPVLLGTANVFICLSTYTQAPLTCASLSEATSFASHSTWRVCGDDGDDFSVALHEHDRLKCHTDS